MGALVIREIRPANGVQRVCVIPPESWTPYDFMKELFLPDGKRYNEVLAYYPDIDPEEVQHTLRNGKNLKWGDPEEMRDAAS
jgi:hypothetical protein